MPTRIKDGNIIVSFAYDQRLVEKIREVPGRNFDPIDRVWTVPAKSWYAKELIRIMTGEKLTISQDVKRLAEQPDAGRLTSDLEYNVGDRKPYPFQMAAVEFLDEVKGRGLIADEVGLGKTIEVLCWARRKKITSLLVVAPASVTYKWGREIKAWYPELEVQIIDSGKVPIRSEMAMVISYDLMRNRVEELVKVGYKTVVLDEVHNIKDYKALRTKAAQKIAKKADHVIGLSGTPLLNKPKELFNFLNILDPKAWSFANYMKRYCWTPFEGYNAAVNLKELEGRLQTIMIRRFKRQVNDQMPSFTRVEVPVQIDMTDYKKVYKGEDAAVRKYIPNWKGYFANALDWTLAMRIVIEDSKAQVAADWAADFLQGGDEKLVIYCSFRRTIAYLEEALKDWGVLKIVGDMSARQRDTTIQRWQTKTEERVMLLTSAGGQGIDLFGKNGIDSSTLLFVGREWNPAMEEQVEGRLDRTGQTFAVKAYYLIATQTVDQDVHTIVGFKRDIIKHAIGDKVVETISQDLMDILRQRGEMPHFERR